MKQIGYYKDIPTFGCSAREFKNYAEWDPYRYYLVDNKYIIRIDEDGDAIAFGQREPNGTIFEFAQESCFAKAKRTKNVYKEEHNEKECPIHVEAEYNVEELTEVDLYKLSAPIDRYLEEMTRVTLYDAIMFTEK